MAGASQFLLEVSSEAGTSRFPARGDHLSVGRATSNDLVLADQPSVSRHHAELIHHDGAWTIRDLDSSNGTYVNGVRVAPGAATALGLDDVIGVGSVTIRLIAAPPEGLTVEDAGAAELHRLHTILSDREREVLGLVAGGRTDDQIARALFISVKTVHSHLDRIRDKTGVRRRADLTRLAVRLGLPPPAQ